MQKSRYSESQIVKTLKKVEGSRLVKEVCREDGGMEASDVKRLKQMYAELSLDRKLLKDVIERNL